MKHSIIFLSFIFLTLTGFAQSNQDSIALAKADSLGAKAEELLDSGNINQAIVYVTEALQIHETALGKRDIKYASLLNTFALCNAYLGNYNKAIEIESEALKIRDNALGKMHPDYASSLSNIAGFLYDIGNYNEALQLCTEALHIREQVLGKDHPDYASSLDKLASIYSKIGKYAEAMNIGTKAIQTTERILGKKHPNYATTLDNLAGYYYLLGNYNEAIHLATESLQLRKDLFGDTSLPYALSLNNLSCYYFSSGNFKKALDYSSVALSIRENILGENHPDYVKSLDNMANCYLKLGEFNLALKFGYKALQLNEKLLGKEHPNYISSLNNVALFNSKKGNYKEAILLCEEALKLIEKKWDKENPEYANSLSNLSQYYFYSGNYENAMKFGTIALKIREKIFGKESSEYTISLNNIAQYKYNAGHYYESINLFKEVLQLLEKISGKENPHYAISLGNLASCYSKLGDYKEGLMLNTEALNIAKKIYGEDNPEYAIQLNNVATCLSNLGEYGEALNMGIEALKIIEKSYGKINPVYVDLLANLAGYYSDLGNYSKAISLNDEALRIVENVLGKENPNFARLLSNQAKFQFGIENYNMSIELGKEALRIYEISFGKEHSSLSFLYENLACYSFFNDDFSGVERYMNEFNKITPKIIKNTFEFLTEKERDLFWNKYKSAFLVNIHKSTFRYPSSLSLVSNGCDAILMGKGLLLSTSQEMRNLIAEKGDSETLALYDEMRMIRLQLVRLYEKPIAKRLLNTDSLEQVVDNLERQLLEKSQEYGDFTKNLMIKWQDVQQALGAKDVAVEFVSFDLNEDSTMYVAYVNKPGIDCPIFVPLFEEKQLKTRLTIPKDHSTQEGKMLAVADAYLPSQQVSELVWKPLAQYLDGAESIYFAPSGELYNLAIESLPDWENSDRLMSDHWPGLCRVSSTREIAINRDRQPINSSVTYGGLKYDMNADLLTADSKKYGSQGSTLETSSLMAMVKGQNGDTWSDMPITLDEAASVHESLNKAGVDDTPYLEEAGTEASFKSLSGQRKNMMFLSTHGFFWNTDEAKKHRREHTLQFVSLGNEDRHQSVEDMAMTRSGLLFSGANYAWQGNELSDGVDDGFLTAKEISQLDLRGLGLVVLSACQTGLGDVSGEGVFGLQRGFKKAGAQSILMSLWEVNAYSTKLLMTEFCKNVFEKKMNKRDALRAAQETVKNFTGDPESLATKGINITSHGVDKDKKYKKTKQQTEETITQPASDNHPFAHPYYWAGFILLDALD